MALFGHSLGAQLALSEASVYSRVACVVSVSGSFCFGLPPQAKLPPIFVLHGDQDQVVFFERVSALEAVLNQMGTPCEKRIYSGIGHNFDCVTWIDVIERSAEYLSRTLGQNIELPSFTVWNL